MKLKNYINTSLYTLIFLTYAGTVFSGQVSFSTFYPPPKNTYDQLRLIPRPDYSGSCAAGSIYVDQSGGIQYCSGLGTWGLLSGLWTQNGDNIYPTSSNTPFSIGIGTTSPQYSLEIKTDDLLSGNPINWASQVNGSLQGQLVMHGNSTTVNLLNVNTANSRSTIKLTEVLEASHPTNPGDFNDMWGFGRLSSTDGGGFYFGYKTAASGYEYYDDAGLSMYGAPFGYFAMGKFKNPQKLLHILNDDGVTSLRLQERNNTDSIWELRASDSPNNFSIWGGAEGDLADRLTITEDGNVGIGTNTPTAQLHIAGDGKLLLEDSSNYIHFIDSSPGEIHHSMDCCAPWFSDFTFQFKTDPSRNKTWGIHTLQVGNNGIGINQIFRETTYSLQNYNQSAGIEDANPALFLTHDDNPGVGQINWQLNTSGDNFQIRRNGYLDGGTTRPILTIKKDSPNPSISLGSAPLTNPLTFESGAYFKSDGDICSTIRCLNAATSDLHLKKEITTYTKDSLNKFLNLRPVQFNWKYPKNEKDKKLQTGFIAQEVQKIFPEWVAENKNNMKTLYMNTFNAHTINSLQQLDHHFNNTVLLYDNKIKTLNKKIKMLNEKIKINNQRIKANNLLIKNIIHQGTMK